MHNLGPVDKESPKHDPYELSDEDRRRIIEQARKELPELDRQRERAIENLRRIAAGQRPLR